MNLQTGVWPQVIGTCQLANKREFNDANDAVKTTQGAIPTLIDIRTVKK